VFAVALAQVRDSALEATEKIAHTLDRAYFGRSGAAGEEFLHGQANDV